MRPSACRSWDSFSIYFGPLGILFAWIPSTSSTENNGGLSLLRLFDLKLREFMTKQSRYVLFLMQCVGVTQCDESFLKKVFLCHELWFSLCRTVCSRALPPLLWVALCYVTYVCNISSSRMDYPYTPWVFWLEVTQCGFGLHYVTPREMVFYLQQVCQAQVSPQKLMCDT